MSNMSRSDVVKWAKEMTMDTLDKRLVREALPDDLEEEIELLRVRNRIAIFLGMPTKDKLMEEK